VQVDTANKIVKVLEAAVLPGLEDQINRTNSHIFNRSQPEAYGCPAIRVVFYTKIPFAVVNIRRQDLDAHRAGICHVKRHLSALIFIGREQRGHVFHREMLLQVSRFDRDNAVIGSVAFIETIAGEIIPPGEDFFCLHSRNLILLSAGDKFYAVLINSVFVLLGDGFTQVICF